jgi:hypothetical protein
MFVRGKSDDIGGWPIGQSVRLGSRLCENVRPSAAMCLLREIWLTHRTQAGQNCIYVDHLEQELHSARWRLAFSHSLDPEQTLFRRLLNVRRRVDVIPHIELFHERGRCVRWLKSEQVRRLLSDLPGHQRLTVMFALSASSLSAHRAICRLSNRSKRRSCSTVVGNRSEAP